MKKNHTKSINRPVHILVIRLSAMGDVALTLPVVRGLLNKYPSAKITVLTRAFFAPFFANIPNLTVKCPDLKGKHKGLLGLTKLFKELAKEQDFDYVIDLHSVIRSRFLSGLFLLSGKKVFTIRKSRKEKKRLLNSKEEPQLAHTITRYKRVFEKAGFEFELPLAPVLIPSNKSIEEVEQFLHVNKLNDKKVIGIAPFAKHDLKIWPQEKLVDLLQKLQSNSEVAIILFGGGKEELEQLNALKLQFDNCIVPAIGFINELALMQRLAVMLSMDSSNMHLATLAGVPVVSVWGATHPGIGFGAWNQPNESSIQIPKKDLDCRPCTIYGKGECKRGDFACMNWIESERVYKRIIKLLP